MSKKIASWSFSALEQFRNCPRQYQAERITKEIPYVEGPAQKHGNWVHKMFEDYIASGRALPPELLEFRAILDRVCQWPDVKPEWALAIDKEFKPIEYFSKQAWCRAKVDVWSVDGDLCRIVDWKGLPLDTELPTPEGFTTMGAVSEGDLVFGSDGAPARVVAKSPVTRRACFDVVFDDNTAVTCDDVHLWSTTRGVLPVTELKMGDAVPVCLPAQYTKCALPVDPYVFGLWLADGKHTSSEITKPDEFVWEEIVRRGYELGARCPSNLASGKTATRTIKGIRRHLVALGVMGNKHIPDMYLYAGVEQRIDLLRGLMDGDGNANPARKQAVFTTTNRRLSDSVKQLAESLGQRVNQATTTQRGFGLTVTAYPLAWRPQHGINPFLLPRKASRIDAGWGPGASSHRRVVAVVPRASRDTACIAVDSPDNTYLCTRSYVPTHNTGKRKYDYDQLLLNGLLTMCHLPNVNRVKSAFFWTKEGKFDVQEFKREDWHTHWQRFLPDVARIERASELNVWQEKPSGLCNGWCRVESCVYWKPKQTRG